MPESPQGQEASASIQPQDENPHVYMDKNANPTDRAVSFWQAKYVKHDSELNDAVTTVQLQKAINHLPHENDPSYGDELVRLLDVYIKRWVTEVTARYSGSDPTFIRKEIEAIIRNNY